MNYRHSTLFIWLASSLLTSLGNVYAQAPDASGLRLLSVTRLPQSRLEPGGMLVLRATVQNVGEADANGVVVATLAGFPERQSACRVTVPSELTLLTTIYISLPTSLVKDSLLETTVTLYVDYGGQEVVQDWDGQPAKDNLTLRVRVDTEPLTALILDPAPAEKPSWYWPPAPPHSSYQLAVATRVDAGYTRLTANFDSQALPLNQSDWSMVDAVMIGEAHALDDAAFVESLNRFVAGGGRAWIMLDRVPPSAIRPLLGANQMCELVEEIELNSFSITYIDAPAPLPEEDLLVSSSTPFKFKRVVQSGGRVTHEIDGWPAAIWMPRGYGELLLTTLDCAAWIEPRADPSPDPRYTAYDQTRVWAKRMATEAHVQAPPRPLANSVEYPLQLIGTPVVPKVWVGWVLGVFCLALAGVGAWLRLGGELSPIGWLAPAMAITAGLGLWLATFFVRTDIQPGVTKLQLIQLTDDGQTALAREQAAVYLTASTEMQLEGRSDGRAVADEKVSSGIRRFELNDFQHWRLGNIAWPTGTWRYRTEFTFPTQDLVVTAKLTDQGIQLLLPELPSSLQDPVLHYRKGNPLLCRRLTGSLLADGSLAAGDGRWIADTVMNKEQQRRSEVYQTLFLTDGRAAELERVLYGWTDLWPQDPDWSLKLPKRGSALVALPVHLKRPEPEEEIYVPHGLIQLRRNPDRAATSVAFDEKSRTWVKELTMAVAARVQVVLPEEVLPFAAAAAEIELDISAPLRRVRLLCDTRAGPVELVSLDGPSVPVSVRVTDAQVLDEVQNGTLDLTLEVSDRTDVTDQASAANIVTWQVDDMNISFRGRRMDPTAPQSSRQEPSRPAPSGTESSRPD